MEVKIGVQHAPRELVVETDESAEDVEKLVAEAARPASGVLALTDTKGRRVLVPAAKLAYVEIGGGVAGQVGFRSLSVRPRRDGRGSLTRRARARPSARRAAR